MLKDENGLEIIVIAYCELCRLYSPLYNEKTARLDAETKISTHAATKHQYRKDGMRWTTDQREMESIRRRPGYEKGFL